MEIHATIIEKLDYFYTSNKIPHIIFHGSSGSGKRTIVNDFLNKIYQGDKQKLKGNVMTVNCAHGKGIKFIREELKFFAKSNLQSNTGVTFKTIVLLNADSLTIDAQSALRRCIEQFSTNTRFFMVTSNKYRILKPILSRFCEVYVPLVANMHRQTINDAFHFGRYDTARTTHFKYLMGMGGSIVDLSKSFVSQSYSAMDLATFVMASDHDALWKYRWLMNYHKIRKEFRNEELLFYVLLSIYFRKVNTFNLFM
jgi:hypothetical protein